MWATLREHYHPAVIAIGVALVALATLELLHWIVRRLGRHSLLLAELSSRAHRPNQVLVTLAALSLAVRSTTRDASWREPFLHGVTLAIIAAAAWLVAALLVVAEDVALARFRTDVPDNQHARRIHTQVVILRRVTVAVVAVLAVGVMLLTFPSARTAGASLLASAGVLGVIAGFAAQSTLGNVIAGLQLAFSDALRIDDVVVVEEEWGRIEEITLSYVVLHVWDDRRLILPTSYFTTTPFQQWTRRESPLLGTVEIDVDWTMPIQPLRDRLREVVGETELWDGRVCVLQLTEAVGPAIRVRALVSAADAPSLWDLRCLVRESLVAWIRDRYPQSLPRYRLSGTRGEPVAVGEPDDADRARVFGGSSDGEARSHAFVGPAEVRAE